MGPPARRAVDGAGSRWLRVVIRHDRRLRGLRRAEGASLIIQEASQLGGRALGDWGGGGRRGSRFTRSASVESGRGSSGSLTWGMPRHPSSFGGRFHSSLPRFRGGLLWGALVAWAGAPEATDFTPIQGWFPWGVVSCRGSRSPSTVVGLGGQGLASGRRGVGQKGRRGAGEGLLGAFRTDISVQEVLGHVLSRQIRGSGPGGPCFGMRGRRLVGAAK